MEKNIDHGPNNIKNVRFFLPSDQKNEDNHQHDKRKSLINEISKYDDWFNQLVKFDSKQVTEKINHLLDQINLEIRSENCFNLLLKQVQHWYEENGDRESMTDFNYKIKAEIEPQSGNKYIIFVEEYNEEDLIPESDDDDDTEEYDIFGNYTFKNYYESVYDLKMESQNGEEKYIKKSKLKILSGEQDISDETLPFDDKINEAREQILSLNNINENVEIKLEKITNDDTLKTDDKKYFESKFNNSKKDFFTSLIKTDERFSCDTCENKFTKIETLKNHINTVHCNNETESYFIEKTDYLIQYEFYHIETENETKHYRDEDFVDSTTSDIFKSEEYDLNNIIKTEHENSFHTELDVQLSYACNICTLTFPSNELLIEHLNEDYSLNENETCDNYFDEDEYDYLIEPQIVALLRRNGFVTDLPVDEDSKEYDDSLLFEFNSNTTIQNSKISIPISINFSTLEEELNEENHKVEYKSLRSDAEKTTVHYRNKATYSEKKIGNKNKMSLTCEKCHKKIKAKCNNDRHVELVHESEKVEYFSYESLPFTCNLCDFTSNLQSEVPKHMKTVHEGNFEYLNSFLRSNNEKLQKRYKIRKVKLFVQNWKRRKLKMKRRKENLKRKK